MPTMIRIDSAQMLASVSARLNFHFPLISPGMETGYIQVSFDGFSMGGFRRRDSHAPSGQRMKNAARGTAAFSASSLAGVRYFRMLQSSLLEPTSEDTEAGGLLAQQHFGLQAQEPDAVLLSIFNRSSVKCSRTVLAERYLRKTDAVVRAWGQRCTLHMYAVPDWNVAMAATRGRLIAATTSSLVRRGAENAAEICKEVSDLVKERLLAGKDVDTSIVNKIADKYNVDSGTRMQLRRYPFLHATEKGLGSRVSRDGKQARLTVITPRTCAWDDNITVHDATLTAAKRYFSTYAPAEEEDFRYWMGLPAAQSRKAVKELLDCGDLVPVSEAEEGHLIMRHCAEKLKLEKEDIPAREEWPVKLLGRFDPYLLPHRKKAGLVSEKFRRRIWQNFAQIIPTVIVHGKIRGSWKLTRNRKAATAVITLFDDTEEEGEPLTQREREMCAEAAREIATVFWEMDECDVEIVDESNSNSKKRGGTKRQRDAARKKKR